VFLEENGSHKTTAERLTLHKNTVQYRGELGLPSARTGYESSLPCLPPTAGRGGAAPSRRAAPRPVGSGLL